MVIITLKKRLCMYQVTPIPAFDDNYIWMLHNSNSKQAVVVDPGDASVVVTALEKQGKTLSAILITHHHSDHTGGVDALVEQYKVPVYGPHNCNYQGITVPLKDADKIIVMGAEFEIKAIPGHTLDHICYFNNHSQQPQIFCGDTLFLAGCGRLFEGSMPQMLAAMEYFKTLPDETQVYCAHEYSLSNLAFAKAVEPNNLQLREAITRCKLLRENNQPTLPSSLAVERLINPFLRCEQQSVIDSAISINKANINSPLEVFTVLRNWKNNF